MLGVSVKLRFGLLVLVNVRVWWTSTIYYFLNSLIIFCVAFGSGNLVATSPPAGAARIISSSIFPSAYAADSSTTELDKLKVEYARLSTQYDEEVKKLSDLQTKGAAQPDIDKQVSVLQDLQKEKDANLGRQFAEVKKGAILGDNNSVIKNPAQIYGGSKFSLQGSGKPSQALWPVIGLELEVSNGISTPNFHLALVVVDGNFGGR